MSFAVSFEISRPVVESIFFQVREILGSRPVLKFRFSEEADRELSLSLDEEGPEDTSGSFQLRMALIEQSGTFVTEVGYDVSKAGMSGGTARLSTTSEVMDSLSQAPSLTSLLERIREISIASPA